MSGKTSFTLDLIFFFYTCSICQFAVSSKACKLSCLVVTALGQRTTYTCRLQSPTVRRDLITGRIQVWCTNKDALSKGHIICIHFLGNGNLIKRSNVCSLSLTESSEILGFFPIRFYVSLLNVLWQCTNDFVFAIQKIFLKFVGEQCKRGEQKLLFITLF